MTDPVADHYARQLHGCDFADLDGDLFAQMQVLQAMETDYAATEAELDQARAELDQARAEAFIAGGTKAFVDYLAAGIDAGKTLDATLAEITAILTRAQQAVDLDAALNPPEQPGSKQG